MSGVGTRSHHQDLIIDQRGRFIQRCSHGLVAQEHLSPALSMLLARVQGVAINPVSVGEREDQLQPFFRSYARIVLFKVLPIHVSRDGKGRIFLIMIRAGRAKRSRHVHRVRAASQVFPRDFNCASPRRRRHPTLARRKEEGRGIIPRPRDTVTSRPGTNARTAAPGPGNGGALRVA